VPPTTTDTRDHIRDHLSVDFFGSLLEEAFAVSAATALSILLVDVAF
jgi:hypothetical protein